MPCPQTTKSLSSAPETPCRRSGRDARAPKTAGRIEGIICPPSVHLLRCGSVAGQRAYESEHVELTARYLAAVADSAVATTAREVQRLATLRLSFLKYDGVPPQRIQAVQKAFDARDCREVEAVVLTSGAGEAAPVRIRPE